jgi:hypothetical protein
MAWPLERGFALGRSLKKVGYGRDHSIKQDLYGSRSRAPGLLGSRRLVERLRSLGLGRGAPERTVGHDARLLQQPLQSRRQEKGAVKMLLLMVVFPTDRYVVSSATYSTYLPEIINTVRLRER